MTSHKLMMLVRNKPGVLARVVVMFSSRGVEVESLSFDPVGHGNLSRVDVVVGLREDRTVDQLMKQLSRLVDVVRVVDVEPGSNVGLIGA